MLVGQPADRTGQGDGSTLMTSADRHLRSPRQARNEVFVMAATRFSEEESGLYTIRVRHPHNGYYAGDFSQAPLFATELWPTSPDRPGVPHAWARSRPSDRGE